MYVVHITLLQIYIFIYIYNTHTHTHTQSFAYNQPFSISCPSAQFSICKFLLNFFLVPPNM